MTDVDLLREACRYAAEHSDDSDTQVGAVLVAANGKKVYAANTFPGGIARHPHRSQRPAKLTFLEHAERAAIYRAAANGVPTAGGRLFAPWFACTACARAIVAAGIGEVVGLAALRNATPERWRNEIWMADQMLMEAGISLRWLTDRVDITLKMDGRNLKC